MIFISGGILILLWIINLWKYIIKQKRYQEISTLLFYINAIVIIILVIIDSIYVPDTDFCDIKLIIGVYGI